MLSLLVKLQLIDEGSQVENCLQLNLRFLPHFHPHASNFVQHPVRNDDPQFRCTLRIGSISFNAHHHCPHSTVPSPANDADALLKKWMKLISDSHTPELAGSVWIH